jgi:hypothetical protein
MVFPTLTGGTPVMNAAVITNGNYASGTSGCTATLTSSTITVVATCATGYGAGTISAVNYCFSCS